MKIIANIKGLTGKGLVQYQRAVYVAKSTSVKHEHKSLYRAGAAGSKGGKNGLSDRYRQHHATPKTEGSLAETARKWDFIWAIGLTDWSVCSTGLAENFLHGFLAYRFFFLDGSSFKAESEISVLTQLTPVFALLKGIEFRQKL